jgi:hypothetical protein
MDGAPTIGDIENTEVIDFTMILMHKMHSNK